MYLFFFVTYLLLYSYIKKKGLNSRDVCGLHGR